MAYLWRTYRNGGWTHLGARKAYLRIWEAQGAVYRSLRDGPMGYVRPYRSKD